jgi:hypothetical protein
MGHSWRAPKGSVEYALVCCAGVSPAAPERREAEQARLDFISTDLDVILTFCRRCRGGVQIWQPGTRQTEPCGSEETLFRHASVLFSRKNADRESSGNSSRSSVKGVSGLNGCVEFQLSDDGYLRTGFQRRAPPSPARAPEGRKTLDLEGRRRPLGPGSLRCATPHRLNASYPQTLWPSQRCLPGASSGLWVGPDVNHVNSRRHLSISGPKPACVGKAAKNGASTPPELRSKGGRGRFSSLLKNTLSARDEQRVQALCAGI